MLAVSIWTCVLYLKGSVNCGRWRETLCMHHSTLYMNKGGTFVFIVIFQYIHGWMYYLEVGWLGLWTFRGQKMAKTACVEVCSQTICWMTSFHNTALHQTYKYNSLNIHTHFWYLHVRHLVFFEMLDIWNTYSNNSYLAIFFP